MCQKTHAGDSLYKRVNAIVALKGAYKAEIAPTLHVNPDKRAMKIRLKYLVYPQFQLPLLLTNAVSNLFLGTFIFVRMQLFFDSLVASGKSSGLNDSHVYFQFIALQRDHLKIEFGIAISVSLIFSSALMLWLSHKLAGPLARLRSHLKETVRVGIYRNLKFRDKDYFQDLPTYLNQAVESITKHDTK